jgi:hypothetical protein
MFDPNPLIYGAIRHHWSGVSGARSRFSLYVSPDRSSGDPQNCTNRTTSGMKDTATVIDNGIIRASSVTRRSTLRGELSGSPSLLVSP